MTLWDAKQTKIAYPGKNTQRFNAVELTLKSNPAVGLVLYELGNGMHIAQAPWTPTSTHTLLSPTPGAANMGFVEGNVNPALSFEPDDIRRQKGAALVRKRQLSPETIEVFDFHIGAVGSVFAKIKRDEKVTQLRKIIKDVGDMTEDEIVQIIRESKVSEVMDS